MTIDLCYGWLDITAGKITVEHKLLIPCGKTTLNPVNDQPGDFAIFLVKLVIMVNPLQW